MKRNVFIFLLFIVAATVFLVVVIYSNSGDKDKNESAESAVNVNSKVKKENVECFKNADCLTAGCSSQLCLPRDQASGVVTSCEWKDEYRCYQESVCGCQQGKCQWLGSENLSACLGQYR